MLVNALGAAILTIIFVLIAISFGGSGVNSIDAVTLYFVIMIYLKASSKRGAEN